MAFAGPEAGKDAEMGLRGRGPGSWEAVPLVPTRRRSVPSQTPGQRPRAALSQPFLAEVSLTRGTFPEARLLQPLSRPGTAINAPSPEALRSQGAWI